jgi:hypothetical protein
MEHLGWMALFLTELFMKYMKEHFIKFIPARDAENPVLIIFMMVMLHMFH